MSTNAPAVVPTWELRHRLARSLELAELDVPEIARKLDVSENTIRNYLKARTTPKRSTLLAWALVTGVPLDWLVGADTPPHAPEGGTPGTVHAMSGRHTDELMKEIIARDLLQRVA